MPYQMIYLLCANFEWITNWGVFERYLIGYNQDFNKLQIKYLIKMNRWLYAMRENSFMVVSG